MAASNTVSLRRRDGNRHVAPRHGRRAAGIALPQVLAVHARFAAVDAPRACPDRRHADHRGSRDLAVQAARGRGAGPPGPRGPAGARGRLRRAQPRVGGHRIRRGHDVGLGRRALPAARPRLALRSHAAPLAAAAGPAAAGRRPHSPLRRRSGDRGIPGRRADRRGRLSGQGGDLRRDAGLDRPPARRARAGRHTAVLAAGPPLLGRDPVRRPREASPQRRRAGTGRGRSLRPPTGAGGVRRGLRAAAVRARGPRRGARRDAGQPDPRPVPAADRPRRALRWPGGGGRGSVGALGRTADAR